jgi:hypothetical protein
MTDTSSANARCRAGWQEAREVMKSRTERRRHIGSTAQPLPLSTPMKPLLTVQSSSYGEPRSQYTVLFRKALQPGSDSCQDLHDGPQGCPVQYIRNLHLPSKCWSAFGWMSGGRARQAGRSTIIIRPGKPLKKPSFHGVITAEKVSVR